jgi:hypothetical protein
MKTTNYQDGDGVDRRGFLKCMAVGGYRGLYGRCAGAC